jgi:hypothetical protein
MISNGEMNVSPIQTTDLKTLGPKLFGHGSPTSSLLNLFSSMAVLSLNFVTFPLTLMLLVKDVLFSIAVFHSRPRAYRHIVASGCTSGIGIEMIAGLVKPGMLVSLISHNQEKVESAKEFLELNTVVKSDLQNLTLEADLMKMFRTWRHGLSKDMV